MARVIVVKVCLLALLVLTLDACAMNSGLIEDGIYAKAQKDSGYTVLKILKVDDYGVHVRTYNNVYRSTPKRVDESYLYMAGLDHKPDEPLGMGHAPISKHSFSTWSVTFVQQSTISSKELDDYRVWQEAGGGYF